MNWKSRIAQHYEGVWKASPERCNFRAGPVDQLPTDFSVLKFPPVGDRQLWTYATCCMSQPNDMRAIELHMFARVESDSIVELLFATAHYHRTGAPLGLGHTVNFGRPWLDASECDHGLISLPYNDGPGLETLKTASIDVKFYWLVPVTGLEVAFKRTNGLEALEELFERAKLDYANPTRKTVVPQ